MNKLMEAREVQRRLKKRVCKHKKIAREALWDTVDAYIALGALQTQMENVVADRNAAQAETRASHAQRVQAIQQRDEAYRLEEAREEARTRTMVLAGQLENDYHHREVEYQRQIQELQNTIAELQHDVHRINNIINPIPPPVAMEEEEEDSEMFMEDDG